MAQYIDKDALVTEIKRRIKEIEEIGTYLSQKGVLTNLLYHLDILEVKKEKPQVCKPKFHKGDWIVFNGNILYVKEIVKGLYRTMSKDGTPSCYDWDIDDLARLWTIQDAKDGDVLSVTMYPEGTWIGIFKEHNGYTFSSHCFVNTKGTFKLGTHRHCNGRAIHPATKEQRNTLFSKMKNAGYTWDPEKNELRELWQKPVKWSEEDEERLKNILSVLGVQVCWDGATGRKMNPYQKEIDWLKSLKSRKQWRPSDVQMQVLKEACNKRWEPDGLDPLYTLYEQLKKLTN